MNTPKNNTSDQEFTVLRKVVETLMHGDNEWAIKVLTPEVIVVSRKDVYDRVIDGTFKGANPIETFIQFIEWYYDTHH